MTARKWLREYRNWKVVVEFILDALDKEVEVAIKVRYK